MNAQQRSCTSHSATAAMVCQLSKYRTQNELGTFPFQTILDLTISFSIPKL